MARNVCRQWVSGRVVTICVHHCWYGVPVGSIRGKSAWTCEQESRSNRVQKALCCSSSTTGEKRGMLSLPLVADDRSSVSSVLEPVLSLSVEMRGEGKVLLG